MSPGKLTARSSLQISFKPASFLFRSERDCCFDLPLPFLHRVRALSAIVFGQSRSEVARYAGLSVRSRFLPFLVAGYASDARNARGVLEVACPANSLRPLPLPRYWPPGPPCRAGVGLQRATY